jgi:serine/threonine protein kinase
MTEPTDPTPTETGTDDGAHEDPQTGSPGPGSALARGTAIGRYLVLEQIGEGGMGVVHAAYDPELDRKIALKLVRATDQPSSHRSARMLREAQALARLAHPNVVAVHDVGVLDDGQVYLAMELVEGRTLKEWARKPGRRWTEIVEALIQAGEGLLAAHRAGLVHRDFKPANCVVDGQGRVRVLDFGLSRPTQALEEQVPEAALRLADGRTPLLASVTAAGSIVGTPAYMPPEQLRGEPADARSDQYSFCVSAWEVMRARTIAACVAPRATRSCRAGSSRCCVVASSPSRRSASATWSCCSSSCVRWYALDAGPSPSC